MKRFLASHALAVSMVSSLIFTAIIGALSLQLDTSTFLPDQGASWYFWQLPHPTIITQVVVWVLYIIHQFGFWYLIFKAKKQHREGKIEYSPSLHKINLQLFALNAVMGVAHLIQTHTTYDGLAQDVGIYTSQGSVVALLAWVIAMEMNERGLFFGKIRNFKRAAIDFARNYHGYFFAWATVYTFWYHPMEGTLGHLIGFFYMFMLFTQGSLIFTHVHVHRWWRVFLETLVLFHGATVALAQGSALWPMFLTGFWGMWVITYMWGVKARPWFLALNIIAYVVTVGFLYWDQMHKLHQITWIPIILYATAIGMLIGFWIIVTIFRYKPRPELT